MGVRKAYYLSMFTRTHVLATAALGVAMFASALVPLTASADQSCVNLGQNMHLFSVGTNVTSLQNYLIANNYLAAGLNTGYFGYKTQAAVSSMQIKTGILASGDPYLGYVGPRTRAAIACNGTSGFTVSPGSGYAPFTTTFTGSNTGVVSPLVDFGDGTNSGAIACGGSPCSTYFSVPHTYQSQGTFVATLKNFTSGAVVGTATVVVTQGDRTAPSAVINPTSLTANSSTATIKGTATNVVQVKVSLDGGSESGSPVVTVTAGQWSASFSSLTNGTHSVTVTDVDAGANSGKVLATGTLTVSGSNVGSSATLTAYVGGNVPMHDITANVGDKINWQWSSVNGASANGSYTIDSSDLCPWTAGSITPLSGPMTLSGATTTGPVQSCRAGHVYTATYTVKGTDGTTATDHVTVHIANPSGAPTASLTASVNGGAPAHEITVNPGDSIAYTWSATNLVTVSTSNQITDGPDLCPAGTANTFSLGSVNAGGSKTLGPISPCRAGHSYQVSYSVTGASGQVSTDSVIIHVGTGGTTPTLSVSPTSVTAGGTVAVSWANVANASAYDWMGLYPSSVTSYNSGWVNYRYVSCTLLPGSPMAFGTCPSYPIPATAAAGDYKFVLFKSNTYVGIATTPLLVTAP